MILGALPLLSRRKNGDNSYSKFSLKWDWKVWKREFFAYRRDRTRQLPLEVDWRVHICISTKIFGKLFGRVESTFSDHTLIYSRAFHFRVIPTIWESGTVYFWLKDSFEISYSRLLAVSSNLLHISHFSTNHLLNTCMVEANQSAPTSSPLWNVHLSVCYHMYISNVYLKFSIYFHLKVVL